MTNKQLYRTIKAIASISWLFFGRYVVSAIVSNKPGKRLPKCNRHNHCWVKCKSGNILYVEEDGVSAAQAIVFIHGLNATLDQWVYQREYFKKQYRLIFIDLPGHGRAPASLNLSMEVLAEDIGCVLGYLKIDKPVIYGHSMGAAILMQYAIKHAPFIKPAGIVLHGGSYTNPLNTCQLTPVIKPLEKPLIVPLMKVIKKVPKLFDALSKINFYNGTTCALFRYLFFTGDQTSVQLRYMASLAPACRSDSVAEALLQMLRFDVSCKLKEISMPSLIIGSINDRFNTLACSEYIHREIKGSQLAVLKQGHQSLIENHSKINKLIEGFVTRL